MNKEEYNNSPNDSDEEFLDNKGFDVVLGFSDVPTNDKLNFSNEKINIEDTFIGGKPIWLHVDSKPDSKLYTCDNCNKKMALLLQAFCPLEDKFYDRVIYVFGCKNTFSCGKKNGSIKCFKGICKNPIKIELNIKKHEEFIKEYKEMFKLELEKQNRNEKFKLLFDGSNEQVKNPFNDENPFLKLNESLELKIQEKKKNDSNSNSSIVEIKNDNNIIQNIHDETFPSYVGYLLYMEKENLKEKKKLELLKYKSLYREKDHNQSQNEANLYNNNLYSKNQQVHSVDKFFLKFSEVVSYNSNQVLRYALDSFPLLYNGSDSVAKKFLSKKKQKLKSCTDSDSFFSVFRFELQLMTKVIIDLENFNDPNIGTDQILDGMSWGTIIICTHIIDEISDFHFDKNFVAYQEEWCGVQWDDT